MAELRLGPLLRYVDWTRGDSATIWVEADRACISEVRCADGADGESGTFLIAGRRDVRRLRGRRTGASPSAGQEHPEDGLLRGAGEVDGAAVGGDDGVDDREPEAGASGAARAAWSARTKRSKTSGWSSAGMPGPVVA